MKAVPMAGNIDLKLDGDNNEARKFIKAAILKGWNDSRWYTESDAIGEAEKFAGPVSRLLALSTSRLEEELGLRTAELVEQQLQIHRNTLPKAKLNLSNFSSYRWCD